MSETKRIVPTTVGVQKNNKNKVKDVIKTFRFALTLTESNDKACPIFNYKDLLTSAKKKGSEGNISNGHEFEENGNDSEVQRLAKHFEEKYGGHGTSKASKNRIKKHFKDDYTDVGAGYDESDSFIDNTEAYDEIVPEDIFPAHGGFYINSGSLEFKQQDISDRDDGSSPVTSTTKSKKRVIESEESDEDDDEEDDDEEEEAVEEDAKSNHMDKKIKLNNDTEKNSKKKIIPSSDENKDSGIQIPKKKTIPENNPIKVKPATVKELLKERREDSEPNVEVSKNSEQIKDSILVNDKKNPIVSTSINDAIESVINAAMEGETDESSKDSSRSKDLTSTQSEESSEFESEQKNNSQTIVTAAPVMLPPETKLPEKLPEDIKNIIDVLKNVCNSSGPKLNFSEPTNKLLLRLEHHCMSLPNSTRFQIYAYVASVLQCKKDTLINKIRKLLLSEESYKMQDIIKRLKDLIEKQMPGLLEDYSKECARVNEKRLTQEQQPDVMNEEKPKTFRMPKRRFPWMEETRKILGEIISIKRKVYQIERVKEKFDQYLEPFYKEDLIPLWPEGWISLATLLKESQPFLAISEKTIKKDIKKVISNSNDVSVKSSVNNVNNYVAEVTSNIISESKHNSKSIEISPVKTVAQTSIKPVSTQSSQSSITLKSNNTTITTTKNSVTNQPKIVNKSIPLNTNCGITIEPIIHRPTDIERKNLKRKTPIPADITVQNNSTTISESSKLKNINGKENEETNTCNDVGINKVQVMSGPSINVSKVSSKKSSVVQNSTEVKKIRLDHTIDLKKSRIEHSTDSKKIRVDPSIDQKKIRIDPSVEQKKVRIDSSVEQKKVRIDSSMEQKKLKIDSSLDQKKIRSESSLEQKKTKFDNGPVISVRKLTDLTSTNSKMDLHPKTSKSPVKEKLPQQAEKLSTLDDIEIIEIDDDDDNVDNIDNKQIDYKRPGPKSKTKIFSNDSSKKVAQNISDCNKKYQEFEKDALPSINSGKKNETDVDDKLKSQNSDQLSYDDVSQVMKHLKELQKLTEISDKSKDNDGVLSHKSSSSPVSVITVNSCKYSSAKSSALSPTGLNKATSDLIGFQDVFQKHLSQEKKDCSSTISNCNFTQGKNNIDSYSYIGSMNPTTSPVVSTSQKYAQNTNMNSGATLLNFNQSTSLPQTGSVSKTDVFPNFMFEYLLNKSTGSSQKSPPY